MKVAIMYVAAQVDAEGHVTGHDAGATLVRRLLRVFPGAMLVGPGTRHCAGFDVIPLEFIDGSETVVINMDVLDSLGVCQTPRESRTSMLMTTVSEPSMNSSGMTSKPAQCRGPGPTSIAPGNTRSRRRTSVAPASCPVTWPSASTCAATYMIATFIARH